MNLLRLPCAPQNFFMQKAALSKPPFRASLRGIVVDVGPLKIATSQSDKELRVFTLVDLMGNWINCVAHDRNARSFASRNEAEVVLYYALGRASLGESSGSVCV